KTRVSLTMRRSPGRSHCGRSRTRRCASVALWTRSRTRSLARSRSGAGSCATSSAGTLKSYASSSCARRPSASPRRSQTSRPGCVSDGALALTDRLIDERFKQRRMLCKRVVREERHTGKPRRTRFVELVRRAIRGVGEEPAAKPHPDPIACDPMVGTQFRQKESVVRRVEHGNGEVQEAIVEPSRPILIHRKVGSLGEGPNRGGEHERGLF